MTSVQANVTASQTVNGGSAVSARRVDLLQAMIQKQVADRRRRHGRVAEMAGPDDTDDLETRLRAGAAGAVREAARATVDELVALLESHGETAVDGGASRSLSTGWAPVDAVLGGGLRRGAVHEWFGDWFGGGVVQQVGEGRESRSRGTHHSWVAPMLVFTHLARRALCGSGCASGDASTDTSSLVLWIGRRCWPSVVRLAGDEQLLARSVFVDDPPERASGKGGLRASASERLWAIDLALRAPSVALVVADGSGLDLGATRRLQLAAERGVANGGAGLALLARSPMERATLSAASTRWSAVPNASGRSAGVRIELLRRKGLRPTSATATADPVWSLEQDDATGDLAVAARLAD